MQPAVINTQVSYSLPDDVTLTAIPKDSLPAIFIEERLIVYAILHQNSSPVETQEGSICLTGELLGAKVEHNMKFKVPPAVTKENMSQVSTIHHLAAKKLIKEMELNEESRFGQRNEEIIKLSCDSSVTSSQTAFIAIDEERKEAVKGSLETWDILPDELDMFCCMAPMSAARKSSAKKKSLGISFGGISKGRPSKSKMAPMKSAAAIAPGGAKGSLETSDVLADLREEMYSMASISSARMDCLSSINSAPKGSVPLKKKSKGISFDGFYKAGRSEAKKKSAPCPPPAVSHCPPSSNPLTRIINLQLASGEWKLTKELADVITKTTVEIKDSCPVPCKGDMETIWMTIIILIYLKLRQANFKDEWELVAMKAETWLSKQNIPEGCSIQVLREKGMAFLS